MKTTNTQPVTIQAAALDSVNGGWHHHPYWGGYAAAPYAYGAAPAYAYAPAYAPAPAYYAPAPAYYPAAPAAVVYRRW